MNMRTVFQNITMSDIINILLISDIFQLMDQVLRSLLYIFSEQEIAC